MDRQKGQQLFLQWLMSQRVCLLKEAELFYCRIFEKDDEVAEGFDSFLDSCGTSLSLFGLKLQRQFLVKDDEKLEFIAICNTVPDKIAQIATNMSPVEIKNFKLIIQELKKTTDFEISFNTVSTLTSMSRAATNSFLNSLLDNYWLELNPMTNKYHLGCRSVLELDEVLRVAEDEDEAGACFLSCSLCAGLIVTGSRHSCHNQSCNQAFHQYCLSSYQQTMRKSECPGCKSEMSPNSAEVEHVNSLVDN